jgi:hypothetical protein
VVDFLVRGFRRDGTMHAVSLRKSLALVVVAIGSVAAVAFAQPHHGRGKPKPKPAAKADAGSESAHEGAAESADAGVAPAAAGDAGPVPPPPGMHGELGDGGVRPSPLTPAPNEFAQPIDAGAPTIDYDKLIADIASLRARVAAVGDTLFHSRIAIQVRTDGDHGRVGRFVVSLDDGAVYTAPPGFKADDWQPVYAHALAPGRHAITVDVERKDDRNDGFRNSQRTRFTVEIPRDQQLDVRIKVGDDSDMGKDFPSDKSGSYDLRVRVSAEAHAVKK